MYESDWSDSHMHAYTIFLYYIWLVLMQRHISVIAYTKMYVIYSVLACNCHYAFYLHSYLVSAWLYVPILIVIGLLEGIPQSLLKIVTWGTLHTLHTWGTLHILNTLGTMHNENIIMMRISRNCCYYCYWIVNY